jgi:Fe-S oxidoreductase
MKIDPMAENLYFNMSCALSLYRPEYEKPLFAYLKAHFPHLKHHALCCRKDPKLPRESIIINVCPGCDMRWRELYEGISTISIYHLIDTFNDFPFPDYSGLTVTIHDSCRVRGQNEYYDTVRSLLQKMHITVVESAWAREKSLCCGNRAFDSGNPAVIRRAMQVSADSLPLDEVLTYCVTCMKILALSGKKSYYLLDLLMNRESDQKPCDIDWWFRDLEAYEAKH